MDLRVELSERQFRGEQCVTDALTAEWIDAQRAVESGIAARVFPDDELLDATLEKAREIARWPAGSLQATKRTLRAPHLEAIWAAEKAEQAGMRAQVGSPENIEAISAFVEKPESNFRADPAKK